MSFGLKKEYAAAWQLKVQYENKSFRLKMQRIHELYFFKVSLRRKGNKYWLTIRAIIWFFFCPCPVPDRHGWA